MKFFYLLFLILPFTVKSQNLTYVTFPSGLNDLAGYATLYNTQNSRNDSMFVQRFKYSDFSFSGTKNINSVKGRYINPSGTANSTAAASIVIYDMDGNGKPGNLLFSAPLSVSNALNGDGSTYYKDITTPVTGVTVSSDFFVGIRTSGTDVVQFYVGQLGCGCDNAWLYGPSALNAGDDTWRTLISRHASQDLNYYFEVNVSSVTANTAPNAVADASNTTQDMAVTTNVLANDTDNGGLNPSSVTVTVPSANGTTSVNTTTGAITFTPTTGFTGTTTYTYQVCDNATPPLCATAVVTITVTATSVDADGDGYNSTVDCNDNNPAINPGAAEVCDLIDNDCDGQTDEGLATTTYYLDTDIDGYGTGAGVAYCANPGPGTTTVSGDCNDNNPDINPGATDIPNNGIDEDCIGGDATGSSTVAVNDNGTCIENGTNASISILENDLINGAQATLVNAEVDIDLASSGFQTNYNASSPSVTWAYASNFGFLVCDPGLNVEGTVTLDYRICEKTNLTNCSGTATVTVVIAPSTASLTEQALVFAVFPNPTKDLLTISSASKVNSVRVIGLDGKEVLHTSETTLNVASLTNGLYHIEINFDNGAIGRSTFMKN